MENHMEIPLKTKNKATIWPSNFTTEHVPWKWKLSRSVMSDSLQPHGL